MIDLLSGRCAAASIRRGAPSSSSGSSSTRASGRAYSKGNRQKVALVAAFAADVELLLLDEPTSGLDPVMEAGLPRLRRRGARGRAHGAAVQPHPQRGRGARRPRDDHPRGRAVESGTLADMRHLHRSIVRAEVSSSPPALTGIAGVHDVVVDGQPGPLLGRAPKGWSDGARRPSTPRGLVSLTSTPPSLEEAFPRRLPHLADRRPERLASLVMSTVSGTAPLVAVRRCDATGFSRPSGCSVLVLTLLRLRGRHPQPLRDRQGAAWPRPRGSTQAPRSWLSTVRSSTCTASARSWR